MLYDVKFSYEREQQDLERLNYRFQLEFQKV